MLVISIYIYGIDNSHFFMEKSYFSIKKPYIP
jgi:hypothetical protein